MFADPIKSSETNECWCQTVSVFLVYFLQTEIPRFQVSKFSAFDLQECQWYTDYALKITENTEDLLLINDFSFSLPYWGHLQCLLAYFWTLNSWPQ